jgi:hypothetical protein
MSSFWRHVVINRISLKDDVYANPESRRLSRIMIGTAGGSDRYQVCQYGKRS